MKQNEKSTEQSKTKRNFYTSLLLFMLALVSVVAATVAWFTIADRAKVGSMNMEITTGANLRFDLDAHDTFDQYEKTLTFDQIANRILSEKKFDMRTVPLDPVTTSDYVTFTMEDGTVVESSSGSYLEFNLHFMASQDMVVHLTSANTSGKSDGTQISSDNSALSSSMRISFAAGSSTYIYDPGMGSGSSSSGSRKTFGLPGASNMTLNNDNALFSLKEGVDQPVTVHIWLEGTDESCTDELRGSNYSIQLRFIGTDENNNELDSGKES
jgi:hypothetical protein